MTITNKMLAAGADKYLKTFEQIKRMGTFGDGSKESCLKMIQEVYPKYTLNDLNMLLVAMDYAKLIEGLTIIDNQVVEPIRPKLTDKAIAEIEKRREMVKQHD